MDLRNMLPTRRFFTPAIVFLILFFSVNILVPREYRVYILAIILPIILIKLVIDLIKTRKEDKLNQTKNFWFSVFSVVVIIAMMSVLYFGTRG